MREKDLKEDLATMAYKAESDHEVQMARSDLYKIAKYSIKLHEMLKAVNEQQGIEGWVQSKITKAADYMGSVYHHLDYEMKFDEMTENKTPGDSHYNKEKAKKLAKADGKDPERLSHGELMDYISKAEKMKEAAKPDFLDMDKDGNKKEPMKKAIKDKEKEKKAKKETVETVGAILYKAEDELINEDLGAALNHLTSAAKEIAKTIGGGAIDAVAGGAGAAAGLPDRIKSKFNKAKSGMQRSSVDYASDLQNKLESKLSEKSKGLYYNVNKRKKAGTSRKKGHPDAPSEKDWENAAKTAKESKETKCPDCNKPSYKTLPEEKQKGVDGKVCWKGYKRMGTKKKGGKTVDNCVKM